MNKIKEILNKIVHSFDTTKEGFSARKLAGFTILIMVVILHIKWFNSDRWEYLGEVLALDFGFIAVCLGMTTYENIMKKKEEAKEEI